MKQKSLILALSLAGVLAACGDDSATQSSGAAAPASAPPAAEPTAAAAPAVAAASAGGIDGQKIYNNVCAMCHAAGVAGAPAPGNKEDWAPRIAQGADTLYKHAIEGYTGQKGMMPARGGSPKLTDDEVKAAVDHMVRKSS